MNNNEQFYTSAHKQHAQTNNKQNKDINNIRVNENEHTKLIEFDVTNDSLTNEQKIKLNDLLNKYRGIFSKHSHDLGEFTGAEFKIELKSDAKLIKNYRTAHHLNSAN